MSSHQLISSNEIRRSFTVAMSAMYRNEVPQYDALLSLVEDTNNKALERNSQLHSGVSDKELMQEHHGAIRLGTADELFTMRRLFAVMGMLPVDYYDLSVTGIPVHSTAFRAIKLEDLQISPFRMFTSLLKLDLIEDEDLKKKAKAHLSNRSIFSTELRSLIDRSETQGGLTSEQSAQYISNVIEVFRWHHEASVTKQEYAVLKAVHALITDIVSFKGPHINHLTPRTLDIDEAQVQLSKQGFTSKRIIEGPPFRECPILLRQTSFLALEESIVFADGESGKHTARFGEIEQRGIALTPKGRRLYDHLLQHAKNQSSAVSKDADYSEALVEAFTEFPDSHKELHKQQLAYYSYSANTKSKIIREQILIEQLIENGNLLISPIIYEDFLPVSAAGIFTSNLGNPAKTLSENTNNNPSKSFNYKKIGQALFEEALGTSVISSFSLYKKIQQNSLDKALNTLGLA